jgi:hypothetical protein
MFNITLNNLILGINPEIRKSKRTTVTVMYIDKLLHEAPFIQRGVRVSRLTGVLYEHSIRSDKIFFRFFTTPKITLPLSQAPAFYFRPDKYNSHPHIQLQGLILIFSTLRLGLASTALFLNLSC